MKNRYQTMMKNITIAPEARAFIDSRIEAAPAPAAHTHAPRRKPLAAIAACLAVVFLLAAIPTAAASNRIHEIVQMVIEPFGFTDPTVEYVSPDGSTTIIKAVDENGKEIIIPHSQDGEFPFWVKKEDDRLYFVGDGKKTDITDQFDMETPFTSVFTHDQIIYHVAFGGIFDPNDPYACDYGWAEWLEDAPGSSNPLGGDTGWIKGHTNNAIEIYEDRSEGVFPWFEKAERMFLEEEPDWPLQVWTDFYASSED